MKNPFRAGAPALGPYFYDRSHHLDAVMGEGWNWVCGQRRCGKTSILMNAQARARKGSSVGLYANLHFLKKKDMNGAGVVGTVIEQNKEALAFLGAGAAELSGGVDESPASVLAGIARRLSERCDSVLLLWDEADLLLEVARNDGDFLPQLRARLEPLERLRFVLAAPQELAGLTSMAPDFLTGFDFRFLAGFDDGASRELLLARQSGGWQGEMPREAVTLATEWGGGHPYMLQLIGRGAWEQTSGFGQHVSLNLLREQFLRITETMQVVREIFIDDFRKLTPPQQAVLSFLCEIKEPISFGGMKEALQGLSDGDLNKALIFLSSYGYIQREDAVALRYRFYQSLMPYVKDAGSVASEGAVSSIEIKKDVFLSYNRADQAATKALAIRLREDGLEVWFDEWDLVPGSMWQAALETGIGVSRTAAILIGPAGLGQWQESEMRAFLDLHKTVIPVLLPGFTGEAQLPLFLKNYKWVDLRNRGGDGYEELVWGITGRKPAHADDDAA